ncbi:MAG: vitamin K epoxide reductase family protein [Nanoarchaeota archaeon]
MKHKKQRLLLAIIVLSLLGAIVSGYLINVHYSGKSLCDFNNKLSCSLASKSRYAELWGIPIAVLGVMFYSILGLVSFSLYHINKKVEIHREIHGNGFTYLLTHPKLFLLMAIPALIFSFYLTYAEFFLIGVVCIGCLISQGTILGIAITGYKYHQLEKQATKGGILNSKRSGASKRGGTKC